MNSIANHSGMIKNGIILDFVKAKIDNTIKSLEYFSDIYYDKCFDNITFVINGEEKKFPYWELAKFINENKI